MFGSVTLGRYAGKAVGRLESVTDGSAKGSQPDEATIPSADANPTWMAITGAAIALKPFWNAVPRRTRSPLGYQELRGIAFANSWATQTAQSDDHRGLR